MAVSRDEVVGRPTGRSTVTVERGPVTRFAEAVTESSPIYRDVEAARAAGFDHYIVKPYDLDFVKSLLGHRVSHALGS